MTKEQGSLFDMRSLKGQKPQGYAITPPTAEMSVLATVPAYHAHLSTVSESKYTPDDFKADVVRFGKFVASKPLQDVQPVDIQQWIGQLKQNMPAKTVSRKIAALVNYFRWLEAEKVLRPNPAQGIRAPRITAPLPDILFENECERLLKASSNDPRTYLLVLLLLETGLKKSELLELQVGNFDFSNKYQPELWLKHQGKQAFKDRKLKLPVQIVGVFNDYVQQHDASGLLFPYSPRFIEQIITEAAKQASITKKVTPGILRDMFVVRGVRRGEKLDVMLEKLGLARTSFDDARKKYGRLTQEAL